MLADPMTASTNHKYKRLRLVSLLCAIKHEVQQLPKQSFPVVHGAKTQKSVSCAFVALQPRPEDLKCNLKPQTPGMNSCLLPSLFSSQAPPSKPAPNRGPAGVESKSLWQKSF